MHPVAMRRRVASARVGGLSTLGLGGRPHLVPVCFALAGDEIVTMLDGKPKSTTALRRFDNVRANPEVSLLASHYEEDWSLLWWVRVDGDATVIDGPDAVQPFLEPLLEKYPQYRSRPPTGPAIVIRPTRWVGWSAAD
jgi:PPOX class probable F420-dependent enzyme